MAEFEHQINWLNKNQNQVQPPPPLPPVNPNVINELYAINLVTDVLKLSINIVQNSIKVGHVILPKVTNWNISGNSLYIYSEDPSLLTLNFVNTTEAQSALTRFETAMNGGAI